MKLAGILCLVLACAGAGCYAAGRLRREVSAFEQLIRLTESAAAYIRCQAPELEDLLRLLSAECGGSFRFLAEVSEELGPDVPPAAVWRNAVRRDPVVPGAAREILYSLGEVLGTTDIPGQLSAIALHRSRLERAAADSRERCARQGKLYRALGLLGGAMTAVLLL